VAVPADASPRRLVAVSHTGLFSGAEAVLARVLEAAAEDGWTVVCLTPDGPLAERLRGAGIATRPLPELKLPGGPRVWGAAVLGLRSAVAGLRLRRQARDADVVLVNGILALPALRLARVGPPAAWLVHDVVHRRDWMRLLRACAGAVDEAVAVSEAAAAPVRAAGIRARVVLHGVSWPVEPVARPSEPPVVGCTALLTPWKGQDVLLEAVARLPGVELELVGGTFPKDAAYAESLRARAARPDLAGRVRFLGHVDDVLARVRTWRVGVSASVDPEAGPLSILEYMSVGVPTVATAHGGSLELVGDAGLLVPPGDAGALAEAIERLVSDEELWRRTSAAGPAAIAERRLTDARFRADVLAALEEIAA
jgi:glycosyltransferase involved in cell wall biosynthesis